MPDEGNLDKRDFDCSIYSRRVLQSWFMWSLNFKLGPQATVLSGSVPPRYSIRSVFLLVFLGLVGGSAAARTAIQNAPIVSPGPGPQFAIADFDGDLHPDLASVLGGQSGSGATAYWIQFQLSAAGRQSIRLVAPSGGLQIEARDVNGDHAVDLILFTAWFRQPVAILLNDGHGRFSRVEPSAFPRAFRESEANWVSGSNPAMDLVDVPPHSRAGASADASEPLDARSQDGSISPPCAGFPLRPLLVSQAGRAPPSEVPHP